MKNIILFNPKYRVRIYFYTFVIFLISLLSSFIFVIHQARYYVASEIKPLIFIFDKNYIDYTDSDNLKFNT
jgi:hypothetical protein